MSEEQAKHWTIILLVVCAVAGLILVIDIGIKNTILQKAEFINQFYGETRERAAEATTLGNWGNNPNLPDLRNSSDAGVETGILPSGGHEDAKTSFPPRAANGAYAPRTPTGHESIPPSDEPV